MNNLLKMTLSLGMLGALLAVSSPAAFAKDYDRDGYYGRRELIAQQGYRYRGNDRYYRNQTRNTNRTTFSGVSRANVRTVLLDYNIAGSTTTNTNVVGNILDTVLGNVNVTSSNSNSNSSYNSILQPGYRLSTAVRSHTQIAPLDANRDLGISTRVRIGVYADTVMLLDSNNRITDVMHNVF